MNDKEHYKGILQHINDIRKKEKVRLETFGDIRPIIHTELKGKRFVAIGSTMYFADNWKTFPDFLYDYIMFIFGKEWFESELSKPHPSRHPVMQWKFLSYEFQKRQTKNSDGFYDAVPSGPYKAYMTLAYDLYLLEHHQKLQKALIKRLKHIDQFQGVRYELFVTSTLIRAGYEINYNVSQSGNPKKVEFVALHKASGQEIAIEAKSRHRTGVLGQKVEPIHPKNINTRLGQLINQAIFKRPNLPYFIFIDMNLPPDRMIDFEKNNLNELTKSLASTKKTEYNRDEFNMILYTNFPYHYGGTFDTFPKDHLSVVIPLDPIYSLKDPKILKQLQNEVKKYGRIPNFFED